MNDPIITFITFPGIEDTGLPDLTKPETIRGTFVGYNGEGGELIINEIGKGARMLALWRWVYQVRPDGAVWLLQQGDAYVPEEKRASSNPKFLFFFRKKKR